MADDDGMDLLVNDKVTRRARPLQVKCRTKTDGSAGTVQFDVRLSTFTQDGDGYLLALLLDGHHVQTAWLVPAREFAATASRRPEKLAMVASPKASSKDRYSPYRMHSMDEVVQWLITDLATIG